MTYFALDPLDRRLCADVLNFWHTVGLGHASQPVQLHALLDGAADPQAVADHVRTCAPQDAQVLYAGPLYESLCSVSPWLIRLHTASAERLAQDIHTLFDLRAERPMLSFIATPLGLPQLRQHLDPFCRVALAEDRQEMLHLRLADTRVLDALLTVLSPAQRGAFVAPGMGLWLPCRNGHQARQVLGPSAREAPLLRESFSLNAQQFAALMDASEPDLVIQQLIRTRPDRFAQMRGSEVHAFISMQIRRARQHGLSETPDFVQYSITALQTSATFDEHPAFAHAIARRHEFGALQPALDGVPDAAWEDVARHPQRVRTSNGSRRLT